MIEYRADAHIDLGETPKFSSPRDLFVNVSGPTKAEVLQNMLDEKERKATASQAAESQGYCKVM